MAIIEFSPLWAVNVNAYTNFIGLNQQYQATPISDTPVVPLLVGAGGFNSGAWPKARLDIMAGPVPTDLTGLTTANDRASDVLVRFTTPTDGAAGLTQYFNPVVTTINPIIISTIYKAADSTGTATWFRLQTVLQPSYIAEPTIICHQIIGTVSVVDGGGDLEMDTTSIVAGQSYRVSGLRLQFPTTLTY